MSPLEAAWLIIKAKRDAPNYRKATSAEMREGKNCGTCKAWDSETGYCEWYDFTCKANHICDAWVKKQ